MKTKGKNELVSLRIDAKTIIMVTPDKATEEYAERWRQIYERDSRNKLTRTFKDANNVITVNKKAAKRKKAKNQQQDDE